MKIERLLAQWRPPPLARSPSQTSYRSYEDYFRGEEEAVAGRAAELDDLVQEVVRVKKGRPPTRWADVASGRGLLLQALQRCEIAGYGIEMDSELARTSIGAGHQVFCGEAREVLEALAQAGVQFDVVSALHLIEHMDWDSAMSLVESMHSVLAPNGCCVLVTPNVKDLRVLRGSFYRDPTHVRPYPVELLEFMMARNGMTVIMSRAFERYVHSDAPSLDPVEALKNARSSLRRGAKSLRRAALAARKHKGRLARDEGSKDR